MSAFLAIVGDTWRQSKAQVVFILMMVMLGLVSLTTLAVPKVFTLEDGTEVLGIFLQENPKSGLESEWDGAYKAALARDQDRENRLRIPREDVLAAEREYRKAAKEVEELKVRGATETELVDKQSAAIEKQKTLQTKLESYKELKDELDKQVDEQLEKRSKNTTPLRKGVELWLYNAVEYLFKFSMWLFIAACAGYFPNMLAAGAIDVLVAKPIERYKIFLGKYIGGLVLYSVVLFAAYVIVFVGTGIRTGVWHIQLFGALPLTIYSVALLYAVVLLIGVLTRSTAFSIVIGYVYYFVIDSIISVIGALGELELFEGVGWIESVSFWARNLFPGFGRLEDSAAAAVVNVPVFDWQPILVALAWTTGCLGLAYWRFHKLDF